MKKHGKIRPSARTTPRVIGQGERLSRAKAIVKSCRLLKQDSSDAEALHLIGLFQIEAEELSEAGLGFELIKALEKKAVFF